jgi:hypothetical protein
MGQWQPEYDMKILINDDIPVSLWEEFLGRNAHATPFQSPSYYRFFNSVKYLSAMALAVSDGNNLKALTVITVQRQKGAAGVFSKRGIIYGGPLVNDDSKEALDLLLKKIDELAENGIIYIEVRNLSDFSSLSEVFLTNGYEYVPYLNFRIDTRDGDLMKKRISSSRLRQIKKAQQQSVTVREAGNAEEVMQFYLILKELYKRKLHKPLPPWDFFLKFYDAALGKYLLVWSNNEIIGGIMCPVLEGRAVYEFYICGKDDEKSVLYPSVMATWSAMEFANVSGIPLFDFMGAGKPDRHYGVRDFKARFGGVQVEHGRYLKIRNPLLYYLGKTGLGLMNKFS